MNAGEIIVRVSFAQNDPIGSIYDIKSIEGGSYNLISITHGRTILCDPNDFRAAFSNEIDAFNRGINNISKIISSSDSKSLVNRYLKCIDINSWATKGTRPNVGEYIMITSEDGTDGTDDTDMVYINGVGMSKERFLRDGEYELMPVGFTPPPKTLVGSYITTSKGIVRVIEVSRPHQPLYGLYSCEDTDGSLRSIDLHFDGRANQLKAGFSLSTKEAFEDSKTKFKVGSWYKHTEYPLGKTKSMYVRISSVKKVSYYYDLIFDEVVDQNGVYDGRCSHGQSNSGWESIMQEVNSSIVTDFILSCNSMKKVSTNNLLDIARQKYPLGTKFRSAYSDDPFTINKSGVDFVIESNDGITWDGTYVRYEGKWANTYVDQTYDQPSKSQSVIVTKTPKSSQYLEFQDPIIVKTSKSKFNLVVIN